MTPVTLRVTVLRIGGVGLWITLMTNDLLASFRNKWLVAGTLFRSVLPPLHLDLSLIPMTTCMAPARMGTTSNGLSTPRHAVQMAEVIAALAIDQDEGRAC
jgi:hypothetical protein